MSADFRDFPAVFDEVVTEVRSQYDPTNVLQPYYGYGTYFELMELCKVKDMNQLEKYPLIWLVWEQGENEQKWIEEYLYTISPRVFICFPSNADDDTAKRYTNSINSILYPVFDILLSELDYHDRINLNSSFVYNVNDHPFWLRNDAGSFDDLSAIEIKLENLLLIKL
jgi:hypothetical protein